MQQKLLLTRQWTFLLLVFLSSVLLGACTDECTSTITYTAYEPVYMTKTELRSSVQVEPARTLQKPGKIYAYGDYLFINEQLAGIHIIDNSNPAAPQRISFLAIPGNVDMAVKGNTLYADNYIDLVVLDITNPKAVTLKKRVEDVFSINNSSTAVQAETFIATYKEKKVTEPLTGSDCDSNFPRVMLSDGIANGSFQSNMAMPRSAIPSGKGGSMARFTITGDHLYTVGMSSLQLFDIAEEANPRKGALIQLGWGIETIFPYQDKLFIGSTTGMHIYDNSNPASPAWMSTYAHVRSCDPVVVDGNLAWVTLRSGNACAGFTNQLEVIDISNPRSPQLLKTYPMQHPHGLGIDGSTLFLCEGAFGLKVFDIKNPLQVADKQLMHLKDQHSYDVIPLGTILLMIGEDGLYQYDYSNPSALKLISKISVSPAKS
ncbi:LVIVD repeat-containing protein [Rufibacter hautae]|uniref:LVIVD repeat-containing protein n=1 Tax=Rufibacter hautae TaxID=2595005 RepID=A0A5B6TDH6_9BACT|nr:hypothetical protein [Rufibacter hautae]KAA3438216.1 hypothetical protein FOA19_13215 [Rufibacter hautae]